MKMPSFLIIDSLTFSDSISRLISRIKLSMMSRHCRLPLVISHSRWATDSSMKFVWYRVENKL